ncbi:hypothetical protein AN639_11120 [Candidatus Epulonipiscium fishelsonii]|uniref:Uncharacterized protein n=1 Tax=Candidatus Epulonipiscium fishelsonii TaxID=77094 RepID=A0ACC8XA67_9FIRM|nr:hypothetical protein AN396_09100 [Epulopiscium sp. SCG-B11WGA-EpuloA1]ONI43179.1 hypothetical protein AN639_11120 [Epulopiscium sp. SCG-B05WGA-EpuloA1]
MQEISWQQLKNSYQPSDFSFESTGNIDRIGKILGQDESIEALNFALNLKYKGYNIYIETESDNLFDELAKYISDIAKTKSIPNDICYIYNFENPIQPRALLMECGDGEIFQSDMKEIISALKEDLKSSVQGSTVQVIKNKLLTNLEYEKDEMLNELEKMATESGFVVKADEEGIGFIPIYEGVPIMQSTYEALSIEEKKQMKDDSTALYELAETLLLEIKNMEQEIELYIKNEKVNLVISQADKLIKALRIKYRHYEELTSYFDGILKDIIENIEIFIEEPVENNLLINLSLGSSKNIDDVVQKYEVNLLVNNIELDGAPVIYDREVSYVSLVGQIKLNSEISNAETEILNIKSGLLHKARGGYLLIKADDLIESLGGWLALKTALRNENVTIKNINGTNVVETKVIEPQPIDLPIKVIIVGSSNLKYLLQSYDKDFSNLFKSTIEFNSYLDYNKNSIEEIAYKVQEQCKNEDLLPVSCNALLVALRYTQKLLGRNDKLSTNITALQEIIREANSLATICITEQNIKDVIYFRDMELNNLKKEINKSHKENRSMISVQNCRVGQINGLAVYSIGQRNIGQPMRITASTYKGKKGIINVEKVSNLSGSSHNKGVEIIEGFLGGHFAQNIEPNLTCKVCMEQSYSGVDGDSASSTELFAIMSSLAQIPIKQSLAVTGSINQHGDIQPIGGVTEKIEGFYQACKQFPNKEQGVIIPYQNQIDLVLSEEIIEAVKNGMFHIYPIKTFKEGIELLTGEPYHLIENKIIEKLRKLQNS